MKKKRSKINFLTFVISVLVLLVLYLKGNNFSIRMTSSHHEVIRDLETIYSVTNYIESVASEMGDDEQYEVSLVPATVVRVVDGDTFIANVEGTEARIRMIGINCPESVSPDESKNCEEGIAASNFTKKYLTEGLPVYLQIGTKSEDQYGRMLAYVWLYNVSSPVSAKEVKEYMYNAILLENGMAEIMVIEPNSQYKDVFENIVGGDQL